MDPIENNRRLELLQEFKQPGSLTLSELADLERLQRQYAVDLCASTGQAMTDFISVSDMLRTWQRNGSDDDSITSREERRAEKWDGYREEICPARF